MAKKNSQINLKNAVEVKTFLDKNKNNNSNKNGANKAKNQKSSSSSGSSQTKHMAKKTRPISVYKKIAVSFIMLTLILVAVVVYFSIVSVKITIIPNKERVATNFIAQVLDKKAINGGQDMDIGGIVGAMPLQAGDAFLASGKDVKDTKVVGTVTIYNNYNKNQPLVKTTRLLSPDNKLFRIDQGVNVPAGGKIEDVPIYADESSAEMEIGPTKFIIPGLWEGLQDDIYAESFAPTKYEEVGDSIILAKDIKEAKNVLKAKISELATKEIGVDKYKGFNKVLYKIDDKNITYETKAEADQKAQDFDISASAEIAVVAFNIEDISGLAEKKLQETLPDDKEIESFNQDNFVLTLDRYDLKEGVADIKIEAVAQMVLREDSEIINPEKLVGLTKEQLDDYLSGLREIAGYEIKFTPSWITKVPTLVDRIKIEVEK